MKKIFYLVAATIPWLLAAWNIFLRKKKKESIKLKILAIENPYTTILGHMTGRLLLSRPGYPVDHHAIIDACAKHSVVIEINANPRRLDMDWEFISYAIEKGVMISIDPDAHDISEYDNIKYGVYMAQKANVKKHQNLSSFSLAELEKFISKLRQNQL